MEIPMSMIEYMWETKRLDREMMRNSEIREERERAVKKARERALKQGIAQGLERGKDQGLMLKTVKVTLKSVKRGMRDVYKRQGKHLAQIRITHREGKPASPAQLGGRALCFLFLEQTFNNAAFLVRTLLTRFVNPGLIQGV